MSRIKLMLKMRIKTGYRLRDIAGETIVVNQGTHGADMTRVISLNSSAKLLYQELAGKDFSAEDVVKVLADTYDIDLDLARKGADMWIDSMKECGILE